MNKLNNTSRVKMDSNWIVKEASRMRAELTNKRLEGVTDIETRIKVMVELRNMDFNELTAALKGE